MGNIKKGKPSTNTTGTTTINTNFPSKKPAHPQTKNSSQKFTKFQQNPATKKTKIIHINNHYHHPSISRPKGQCKAMQTPLHGIRHNKDHKRIQTDEVPEPEISFFSTQTDLYSLIEPKDSIIGNFYALDKSDLVTNFNSVVGDLLDDMSLIDSLEINKEKFYKLVGPDHYKDLTHFCRALDNVYSFEFYTWTRFLRSENIEVNICNVTNLYYHSRTKDFCRVLYDKSW